MNRLFSMVFVVCLLALTTSALAQSQPLWGGATLDWNYSYGKAYCYPGVCPEIWIPQGGADNWMNLSYQFTAPSSDGYFMFDFNVNPLCTVWVDDVTVTDTATGAQLLNDPGFESGGNGFFPWEIEPDLANGVTGGYTPGEGLSGSQCIKFIGGGTIPHNNFSKILQYDAWGTGTLPIQAGGTYVLSYWVKTAQVPEPGSIAVLLSGLGGLALIRRRRA